MVSYSADEYSSSSYNSGRRLISGRSWARCASRLARSAVVVPGAVGVSSSGIPKVLSPDRTAEFRLAATRLGMAPGHHGWRAGGLRERTVENKSKRPNRQL